MMLFAGILAAVVIVLAQAFQPQTNSYLSRIKNDKKEKTEKSAESTAAIAAPSDAVPSSTAAQTVDADPALIREIRQNEEQGTGGQIVDKAIIGNLFRTLFRSVITPQAP